MGLSTITGIQPSFTKTEHPGGSEIDWQPLGLTGMGSRRRREEAMGIGHEIDLHLGEGLRRFVISFHSLDWWVVQVPFLGKVWSYGQDGRGCAGWAALRAQDALRRLEKDASPLGIAAEQDGPVAA